MNTGVIAVRYARALLKCALEEKIAFEVYKNMMVLCKNYLDTPKFKQTIDNPMLKKEKKQELLEIACGLQPINLTKQFIKLVLHEGRENILQYMVLSFITLYRQQKHIINGKLITATTVSADIKKRMEQLILSQSKGTVELNTETNPDIIGGFILEYDTYKLDASIKTNLNSILKQLKK